MMMAPTTTTMKPTTKAPAVVAITKESNEADQQTNTSPHKEANMEANKQTTSPQEEASRYFYVGAFLVLVC
jgi:hypothetical protein